MVTYFKVGDKVISPHESTCLLKKKVLYIVRKVVAEVHGEEIYVDVTSSNGEEFCLSYPAEWFVQINRVVNDG